MSGDTLFDDISRAVDGFWVARFGESVQTIMAFPDPRIASKQSLTYPCVALQVIGIDVDPDRRYGSVLGKITKDLEAGTCTIKHPPIPVHIDFQLDTLCKSRIDDNILAAKAVAALGAYNQSKITTEAGREIYLIRRPNSSTGDLLNSDNFWRKAWRFRVQAWLDDPQAVRTAYLLQGINLTINEELTELTLGGG